MITCFCFLFATLLLLSFCPLSHLFYLRWPKTFGVNGCSTSHSAPEELTCRVDLPSWPATHDRRASTDSWQRNARWRSWLIFAATTSRDRRVLTSTNTRAFSHARRATSATVGKHNVPNNKKV
jgi:anti-sigma-K factor RskA